MLIEEKEEENKMNPDSSANLLATMVEDISKYIESTLIDKDCDIQRLIACKEGVSAINLDLLINDAVAKRIKQRNEIKMNADLMRMNIKNVIEMQTNSDNTMSAAEIEQNDENSEIFEQRTKQSFDDMMFAERIEKEEESLQLPFFGNKDENESNQMLMMRTSDILQNKEYEATPAPGNGLSETVQTREIQKCVQNCNCFGINGKCAHYTEVGPMFRDSHWPSLTNKDVELNIDQNSNSTNSNSEREVSASPFKQSELTPSPLPSPSPPEQIKNKLSDNSKDDELQSDQTNDDNQSKNATNSLKDQAFKNLIPLREDNGSGLKSFNQIFEAHRQSASKRFLSALPSFKNDSETSPTDNTINSHTDLDEITRSFTYIQQNEPKAFDSSILFDQMLQNQQNIQCVDNEVDMDKFLKTSSIQQQQTENKSAEEQQSIPETMNDSQSNINDKNDDDNSTVAETEMYQTPPPPLPQNTANYNLSGHKRSEPEPNEHTPSPSPPSPLQKRQKRQIVEKQSASKPQPKRRIRRLSNFQLTNDMMAMSSSTSLRNNPSSTSSFGRNRNAQQLIHKLKKKAITINLSLTAPQKDILETLSYLSNAVFMELHNKNIDGFKVEYNFMTLSTEVISKLLEDQITNCRQVHMYKSSELRSDATTKLQLIFTLYVLIHLRSIVIASSLTLALVFFKQLYTDSVNKTLLDRHWISRESIAPTIQNSLKQTLVFFFCVFRLVAHCCCCCIQSAIICRKISDHPKMKRIAEIATMLLTECKQQQNRQNADNCKPDTMLIVCQHFTLLKIMEKYMNLEGIGTEFSVLEQNQNADDVLDALMVSRSWCIATTANILSSILSTKASKIKTEFCKSVARIIVYSDAIQDEIGKHLNEFKEDEVEIIILKCHLTRKFTQNLVSEQLRRNVHVQSSMIDMNKFESPEFRLGNPTKVIMNDKWNAIDSNFRKQLKKSNILAVSRNLSIEDFIITSNAAIVIYQIPTLPEQDKDINDWLSAAKEFIKALSLEHLYLFLCCVSC